MDYGKLITTAGAGSAALGCRWIKTKLGKNGKVKLVEGILKKEKG